MGAGTEPVQEPPSRTDAQGAIVEWLDALASGRCSAESFLGAMRDRFQSDRDGYWEILSQVDQYFRRGKLNGELFQKLKSLLQASALRSDTDAASDAQRAVPAAPTAPVAAARESAPTSARHTLREVAIGDVLRQRYRIVGLLGRGGMGSVFEATDEYRLDLPTAGRHVAIKVLHTAVSRRQDLLCELQREFQHLQSLSHPNIVRVHEFDRDGDVAFFTMELLSGALLSQVLGAREAVPLSRPEALAVIRDVGAALSHAHSHDVVHGDINPQNIFITDEGSVRVLDFGASRRLLLDAGGRGSDASQPGPVATFGYASCQLLEGQHPDARDDLFAFACVAYLLLSGRHPFSGRTAVDARVDRVRPTRPPDLGARQWRVLREGMGWERERRPSDIQQWLDKFDLHCAAPRLPALSVLLQKPAPRKRSALLAATGVAAAALLALAGLWALTHRESLVQYAALAGIGAPAATVSAPAPSVPAPAVHAPAAGPPAAAAAAAAQDNRPPESQPPIVASPAAAAPPSPRAAALAARPGSDASGRVGRTESVRVEMVADTVDVRAHETAARVTVRRRGSIRGEATFRWWTESGTAKPVVDFAPVMPQIERIADRRGSVTLSIPVSDTPRSQAKSFYVVIDQIESGAALGARNLTMVTLQPSE